MDDVVRFMQILQQVEGTFRDSRGFLIENADAAVALCGAQASKYNAKATLTLKITFKPVDGDMLITAQLDADLPSPASFPIHVFVDRQGRLVAEDPRQMQLPGVANIRKAPVTDEGGAE